MSADTTANTNARTGGDEHPRPLREVTHGHSFDPGLPIEAVQSIGAANSTGPVVSVTIHPEEWEMAIPASAGSVARQQRHLREAKQAVPRGHPKYARRVIFAWHARLGVGPPFIVNETDDQQTSFCTDCSTGDEPVDAAFFWQGWSSLCAWCSLARFDSDGENPRIAEQAEQERGTRS